jgi:hypothetical protein
MSRISIVDTTQEGRNELDSHADTCVAGANCVLIETEGETVNVYGFSDERKPFEKIPIGTVATAYDDPKTGETVILILHQVLFFGDRLKNSLLCPNQLREGDVEVDDVPKIYNRFSSHSISIPRADKEEYEIPLRLKGVISYFRSRRPTEEELSVCERLELTSALPWEPYDQSFEDREEAMEVELEENPVQRRVNEVIVTTVDEDGETLAEENDTVMKSDDKFDNDADRRCGIMPRSADWFEAEELADRLIAAIQIAADDVDGDGRMGYKDEEVYPLSPENRQIMGLSTKEKVQVLTAPVLAKRWMISLPAAERTMKHTTTRGIRHFVHPSDRRVKTSLPHLDYPLMRHKFYTDTLFPKVKSIHNETCAQVWTDGKGYSRFYPMTKKSYAWETVKDFVGDTNAIPETIVTDGAGELRGEKWKEELRRFRIRGRLTEPYSPWQNAAEGAVREIKKGIRRAVQRKQAPKRLWNYCGQWVSAIRRLTAREQRDGRCVTAIERLTGATPDISAFATFDWYDYCTYIDRVDGHDIAAPRKKVARWLGVAENVEASPLTYVVLPASCRVELRSSVFPLTADDKLDEAVIAEIKALDEAIAQKLGDKVVDEDVIEFQVIPHDIFDDDVESDDQETCEEPESTMPDADDYTPDVFDQYLTAEVLMEHGGQLQRGTVKARVRDANGIPIGVRHQNPILDTREYSVEFPDGTIDSVSANKIAEAMYAQVDPEGREYLILKEIVDHKRDGSAVALDDGYIPGTETPRRTTKGWSLLVEWKDGSSSWVPLKDLKESNPIEVAEYAVANKIAAEPAFNWWVRHYLRQRDRIIKKVKARYRRESHKYGIEIPHSVERALEIDKETGTDFWRKAIEREMRNVLPAFRFTDDDEIPPNFYKEIKCFMVFDVKMDFTRRARLVAGGHKTEPPKESVYSSVVSRESVRLFFLMAALNDLDILSADVQNAYLHAETSEKVWTRAGQEFGKEYVGRPCYIVRALYGLKSSGARFHDYVAKTLRDAGFVSSKADPDVWMRPGRKENGDLYYEYVITYVDDVCVASTKPKAIMDQIGKTLTLKPESIKEPTQYLGAQVKKWEYEYQAGTTCGWGMSANLYVKRALEEVQRTLANEGRRLQSRAHSPLSHNYHPELDRTRELNHEKASWYQGLIGVLRWCVELGRIDIITETSMMASFCTAPREGHLDQVLHIFAYLRVHDRSTIVMDWTRPEIDEADFKVCDWSEYYPDAAEAIPPNMPAPRGKAVVTTCFVDADHAGCLATRRSRTGVILMVNRAPIVWFSKRQNTVETSTFGSEFVALRTAIDLIEGLRYKLRMMGVPLEGATNIYCDNESVVRNTTTPESTLKKKHNAICYHRVREAEAAEYVRIGKIAGKRNLADICTKPIYGVQRRILLRRLLW